MRSWAVGERVMGARDLVPALLIPLLAACGGTERDTALVVHSSLPEAVLAHAEEVFESDFPTVDVVVVQSTGEATLTALRNGDADVDVWWGAPGPTLAAAAEGGLLQAYQPTWLRQPGVGQPDEIGRWQVSLVSPFVIAFNRENVPLAEAPTDWLDLMHHGWAEEIDLVDPSRSPDMGYFVSAMLLDALRRDGDLLDGFDWLFRLNRSVGEYVSEPGAVIDRLRSGDALLTILPRHVVEAARHDDAPWIHYRLPESGSPILSRGVAISAVTTNVDLARTFVELTGTVDVGTVARLHTRWMPGHGDVDVARLGDDFELDMPWRPFPLAPDTIAAEGPGWLQQWEVEVRGR